MSTYKHTAQEIDLSGLTDEARRELLDFFEFLKSKYKTKESEQTSKEKRLLKIFKESKGVLPQEYKFNREEAHDR